MKLFISALTKYLAGLVLVGALLFLPAGSFAYPGAWRLISLLFIPMFLVGILLFWKAPKLLEKRLNVKEKNKAQRGVIGLSGLLFPLGFILAGLDHRFSWSCIPGWLTVVSSAVFLLSYGLYAEVMRENAYLSRTIEVQEGQQVIDTGLYGMIRHPMYTASILLFLSMPILLGSWYSLIIFVLYPLLMVIRIKDEEQLLEKELKGYAEYKKKVRYRLIPFIW